MIKKRTNDRNYLHWLGIVCYIRAASTLHGDCSSHPVWCAVLLCAIIIISFSSVLEIDVASLAAYKKYSRKRMIQIIDQKNVASIILAFSNID